MGFSKETSHYTWYSGILSHSDHTMPNTGGTRSSQQKEAQQKPGTFSRQSSQGFASAGFSFVIQWLELHRLHCWLCSSDTTTDTRLVCKPMYLLRIYQSMDEGLHTKAWVTPRPLHHWKTHPSRMMTAILVAGDNPPPANPKEEKHTHTLPPENNRN